MFIISVDILFYSAKIVQCEYLNTLVGLLAVHHLKYIADSSLVYVVEMRLLCHVNY
jgi:hypothetical protein